MLEYSLDNDALQWRWNISLAPDAALRASDRQVAVVSTFFAATVEGFAKGRTRTLTRELRVGDTAPWTLPEPVPVAFELAAHRLTAAWSSLGDYTDVSLLLVSAVPDRRLDLRYELMVSRGYIEDVGASGATLDVTGVPDLPDEWQIDPARWSARGLEVIRDRPGEPRTTWTVFEQPPAPPPLFPDTPFAGSERGARRLRKVLDRHGRSW